jgi:hypothetical protein
MSSTNTGGPAFPQTEVDRDGITVTHQSGITVRDYFAAKYLEGYMANPELGFPKRADAAREAYLMADAMLKERDA